ncbi:hypothetical protein Vadar_001242 [Vaccinium darrowii]|uniref:Uncharacterized protein n=1 Tax=Vaccinium darrowii TaxID=229202 RepID=A0ACB7WWZ4_9ERIC|nr:hypothetical protein Vadar_001242 [Vaccinium darrowii]
MNIAIPGIVPEKLTEDNYEYWRQNVTRYLIGLGLWDVVSGKKAQPTKDADDYEDWERRNALALVAVQQTYGTEVYYKFRNTVSAKDAWESWEYILRRGPSQLTRPEDNVDTLEADEQPNWLRYAAAIYEAVESGNWKTTCRLIDQEPNAVRAKISPNGDTALHVAILAGHVQIAEELVKLMSANDLEMTNDWGDTALSLVAIGGVTKLAKAIVDKNRKLVTRRNDRNADGHIPVIVASLYNQKEMVHYLYDVTPIDELSPERNGKDGATLLNCLITADIFDVASHLLEQYPRLGLTEDHYGNYTLRILAKKPSAFPSGSKLVYWKKWIYSLVSLVGELISGHLKKFVPDIYNKKLTHHEAVKILKCICKEIVNLGESQLEAIGIDEIIHDVIEHGILEFIVEVIKCDHSVIWRKDSIIWRKYEKGRTIFSLAIALRQEKIFSLIHGLGITKNIMACERDIFLNNFLHLAAKLSPPPQLEHISGAALQMQRELQWFKEVESLVQPKCKEDVNYANKTPSALFTEEHKELAKEGERWMKNTAASGMVVGTLIAALMFTTAFTVPGGTNDQTGLPVFLNYDEFVVFILSNALSMFSSSTSVLMFLAILTTRYAEKDFLRSLPTKLIVGLSCLFLSIATMMIAFGAALFITLHKRLTWVTIPIIVLAVIPVALFCILQFPLLLEMIRFTYISSIFSQKHPLLLHHRG